MGFKHTYREDYSLRVVPESYRRWKLISLCNMVLGGPTTLFFLVMGGSFVQLYGTKDLIIGMFVVFLSTGSASFIFTMIAAETGLDMDLITSGSGFGYKGAGFTVLIYALSYVIYFAIEGSIIVNTIHSVVPLVPLWSLYIIVNAVFIPLIWYGVFSMNYIMWISFPIYLMIIFWSIVTIVHYNSHINFLGYKPTLATNPRAGSSILQVLAIVPSLTTSAMSSADIGRFIPKRNKFVTAFIFGYVINGFFMVAVILLGAWFALKLKQSNPCLYFPALLGVVGTVFVIMTQIRINVLNLYTGSLAFTTFFSRVFNFEPGRCWWVVLLAVLSMILMFNHVLENIWSIMIALSVFTFSWMMAVLSYIFFNYKCFNFSSKNFYFQKGTIPEYNFIGLVSVGVSLVISLPMALGLFGPFSVTIASMVAGAVAFAMVPMMMFIMHLGDFF